MESNSGRERELPIMDYTWMIHLKGYFCRFIIIKIGISIVEFYERRTILFYGRHTKEDPFGQEWHKKL